MRIPLTQRRVLSKVPMLLVAVALLAGCGGNSPAPPTNTPSPTNTSPNPAALVIPTDPIPTGGVPFTLPATKTYKKGWIIVDSNLPSTLPGDVTVDVVAYINTTVKTRKTVTFTKGLKDFLIAPLGENELQGVTAIRIVETTNRYTKHVKQEVPDVNGKWASETYLTNDANVECCPAPLGPRGIFTTPIGVRVYLSET